MRRISIAALALSPTLLYAQAIMPAQPQTSSNVPALHANLLAPTIRNASTLNDRTPTTPERISLDVIPAKLIHSIDVTSGRDWQWESVDDHRSGVVQMIVDEEGKPSQLKIVQSAGWGLDKSLLDAVSQYRFQPAMMNNKPVSIPLALKVNIVKPLNR